MLIVCEVLCDVWITLKYTTECLIRLKVIEDSFFSFYFILTNSVENADQFISVGEFLTCINFPANKISFNFSDTNIGSPGSKALEQKSSEYTE